MNRYLITFQTKDICEDFTSIVSRWQIICAETISEAVKQFETIYPIVENNITREKRN